jgi:hypothetical protein
MTLSPPITIIALLAVGVAGVTWFAPPEPQPPYVAVHLSAATFDKLEHWAKDHPGRSGQPPTVEQAIDLLADGTRTESPHAKE